MYIRFRIYFLFFQTGNQELSDEYLSDEYVSDESVPRDGRVEEPLSLEFLSK